MSFKVFLTADAAKDLEELYQYIIRHDAPGKAEHVLISIENTFSSLFKAPERGAYPKELLAIGIRDLPGHGRHRLRLDICRWTSRYANAVAAKTFFLAARRCYYLR